MLQYDVMPTVWPRGSFPEVSVPFQYLQEPRCDCCIMESRVFAAKVLGHVLSACGTW